MNRVNWISLETIDDPGMNEVVFGEDWHEVDQVYCRQVLHTPTFHLQQALLSNCYSKLLITKLILFQNINIIKMIYL